MKFESAVFRVLAAGFAVALAGGACTQNARRRTPAVAVPASNSRALVCTVTYGGEAKRMPVRATRDPYRVAPAKIEDRFEFKVVYVDAPDDVAGVRVYTYQANAEGPALIHEAKYRAPYARAGSYGFTGLQLVYEPRGGELAYYCEWSVH